MADITVTSTKGEDVTLSVLKTGPSTAIVQLGSNGKAYKLYDIRQIDRDGMACRAEAPGNDPNVLIDVDGRYVILKVTGTMFGIGDQCQAFAIGPKNRQKLVEFLEAAGFPR